MSSCAPLRNDVTVANTRRLRAGASVLLIALLVVSGAAGAQSRSDRQEEENMAIGAPLPLARGSTSPENTPGKVATSSAGKVGQRQTRDETKGVTLTGRLQSRVLSRVEARLRNRIDRYYDPQANATSPFKVAGEQTRRQGQTVRR